MGEEELVYSSNAIEVSPWLIFVVVIIVVAAAYVVWRRLQRTSRSKDFPMNDRLAWQKRWQEIITLLDSSMEAQWQVAIMEADKLFDRVLQSMHLPGKDFGERLRYLTGSRPNLRYVWQSHITRNRLAHEHNFVLSQGIAKQTVQGFGRALKELGVL